MDSPGRDEDDDGSQKDHQEDGIEDVQETESDENELQIYYEPEEIEFNRRTQATDQFEDLLRMRMTAAEPNNSKINI